jgi:hypothetical protein
MSESIKMNQSPLPETTKSSMSSSTHPSEQINFIDAIKQIVEGKKVHKLEWKDREYYVFLNGDLLSIHKPDGVNYQWVINLGDLSGTDYIIL